LELIIVPLHAKYILHVMAMRIGEGMREEEKGAI
jgi:hypothetical protein